VTILADLSQHSKPLLTLRPPRRWAPLSLAEVWHYRDLLLTLAQRDVKVRYKQTALGILWVVLQPLLAALIFAFVFGRIARMDSEGIHPYFVFAYAGLLGWNAFNSTLTRASSSIVESNRLVSKVYFPRLVLPLSTCLTTLIDFTVALVLLVMMMAFFHIAPHWPALLLPAWLALLILLAIGIGLYTSALMVSYRDLQYALPPFLQLLLYASPVAYSAAAAPVPHRLLRYYYLNPVAGLLEGFRWSVFGTTQVHWGAVAYSAGMVVVVFIFGAISFKRMERRFADVI